jgi:hypothetical protein
MIPYRPGERVTPATMQAVIEVRNTFFTKSEGKAVWARIHKRLGTFLSDSAESEALRLSIGLPVVSDEVKTAFRAFGQELYEWAGINHELQEMLMHEQLMKIPPFYEVDDGSTSEEGEQR